MDDKQAFWDRQAQRGSLSGTRDRYAKDLEMQTIARHVSDGMRVLDVGCGDGETLYWLSKKYKITGGGFDYSDEMIHQAIQRNFLGSNIGFWIDDIRKFPDLESFDLIYTQRSLINLDTWEEQRQAILDIISLLKPGGTYVMVECFVEGLEEINNLRLNIGLESIVPPWHNRYLNYQDELLPMLMFENLLWDVERFSGAYYFMSRVVNAWIAHQDENPPNYESRINLLGTLLPPHCTNLSGQTQALIIKKKEG